MNPRREKRSYETVVVYHPSLTEAQLQDEQKKLQSFIEAHNGIEVSIDNWGRKEIAHGSQGQKMGSFIAFKYCSHSEDLVDELNGILRIGEQVLKFQTHRTHLAKRKFKGNPRRSSSSSDSDDFDGAEASF